MSQKWTSQLTKVLAAGLGRIVPNSSSVPAERVKSLKDIVRVVTNDPQKWVVAATSLSSVLLHGNLSIGRGLALGFTISIKIVIRGTIPQRRVYFVSSIRVFDKKSLDTIHEEKIDWQWLAPVKYILEMYLATDCILVRQPNFKIQKFFAKAFVHLVNWESIHQSPYHTEQLGYLMALRLRKADLDTQIVHQNWVAARGRDTYAMYQGREKTLVEARSLEAQIEQIVYPTEVFG